MAFDGLTVRAVKNELRKTLLGGRISKIVQPEEYELILTIKADAGQRRLFISANASLPLIYLTGQNKPGPNAAPGFCMVLRKYIGGGRITDVTQPGNERVIRIAVSHLDEMGDLREIYLNVELMGRHSNIILTTGENVIIDSIKHVGFTMSSVREVLPQREYFIPPQEGRMDPYEDHEPDFVQWLGQTKGSVSKAVMGRYVGISKTTAIEAAFRAGVDADAHPQSLPPEAIRAIYESLRELLAETDTQGGVIAFSQEGGRPLECAPYNLSLYRETQLKPWNSLSEALEYFYANRNSFENMRHRSADLRKQITTILDRNQKKLALQERQLKDTKKREKFQRYGNLLFAFPYLVPEGAKEVTLEDYETGESVKIPLDPDLSATENATRFYDKYAKLKRTEEALNVQVEETRDAVTQLSSIRTAVDLAEDPGDLDSIRRELFESGYVKKRPFSKKKRPAKSRPLHYVTNNGFHIYVGKNNYQNDEITFKLATGGDWWFHAKQIPGSHVILKTEGREVPDEDFLIAASVAGYYSSGRETDKLEIDYVEKKHVKKTPGKPPGFVIYYTNYSMTIKPSMEGVTPVS